MTGDDWIPVGERLPLSLETVLVAVSLADEGYLVDAAWLDDVPVAQWEWRGGEPVECAEDRIEVTHWMPLPPPPKEDGTNLWIVQVEGGDGHWFTVTEFGLRSDGMTREQAEKVAASLRGSTVRIVPADGSQKEPGDAD